MVPYMKLTKDWRRYTTDKQGLHVQESYIVVFDRTWSDALHF